MWKTIVKNFILGILFPEFCFLCQKEGSYLCQDCQEILEISGIHHRYQTNHLYDLYFAIDYQKSLIKKIIQQFKYEPYIKELSKPLASFILNHFQLLDNKPDFNDFSLVPVPLEKRRLKRRGFNQAEEIAKELGSFLKIPLLSDCLIKIKKTPPQAELSEKERKENIKGVFLVKDNEKIENKKILLVDDVYTTGSTMEECARALKQSGAKEVCGLTVARG